MGRNEKKLLNSSLFKLLLKPNFTINNIKIKLQNHKK